MDKPRVLILRNHLSPGDVLTMTAAIYSLHQMHPGKYLTAVETSANALWEFNPNIIPVEQAREQGGEDVEMHYPLVNQSNQRAAHMMHGYCEYLESNLRVPVPLMTNKPMIYLSQQEKEWMNQVEEVTGSKAKFWLICAGRKNDFTAKFWGQDRYQKLVHLLKGKIQFVQVGEAGHHHPPLDGVINLLGKTDCRQFIRLCYHAQGGVGGTTFLMHLMAAHEKPYVCIMGGREPVQWNSYPRQQLLHTIGMLPCCKGDACWKSRTVKLNDGAQEDNSLCDDPVMNGEAVPRCLTLITPEQVAETILKFRT